MRTTIKIGNLPDDSEIQAIRDIFDGYNVHILFIEVVPSIAFVHCSWTTELQDIVTSLSGSFLQCGRVLTFQLTEGDEDVRRREETRKKNQTPSCTLFIVGFDTSRMSESDISFSFSEVARVQKVMIRKNFCFVRFRDVKSSTLVMDNFHGKTVLGNVISIEYGMPGGSSSIIPSTTLESNASSQQLQLSENINRKISECRRSKSRKRSRSRSRDRISHDRHNKTFTYDRDRHYIPSESFPCKSKSMGPLQNFQIRPLSDIDVHARWQSSGQRRRYGARHEMENHRQSNKTNTGHSRSTDKRPCSNQSGSDNLCDPSLSDQLNSHSTSAEHRPVDGGAVENPSRFDEGSPRGKGVGHSYSMNVDHDIERDIDYRARRRRDMADRSSSSP